MAALDMRKVMNHNFCLSSVAIKKIINITSADARLVLGSCTVGFKGLVK